MRALKNIALSLLASMSNYNSYYAIKTFTKNPTWKRSTEGVSAQHRRLKKANPELLTQADKDKLYAAASRRTMRGHTRSNAYRYSVLENPAWAFSYVAKCLPALSIYELKHI